MAPPPQKKLLTRQSLQAAGVILLLVLFTLHQLASQSASRLSTSSYNGLIFTGLSITSISGNSESDLLANSLLTLPNGLGRCERSFPETKIGFNLEKSYVLPPMTTKVIDTHLEFLSSIGLDKNKLTDSLGHDRNEFGLLQQIVLQKCQTAIETWGTCTTGETGFATGTSAVAILQTHGMAVEAANCGMVSSTHYAIDPLQQVYYNNAGARGVANYFHNSGASMNFYLVNETAALSLASFTKSRSCFDVILLDDGHKFEENIMEITLAITLVPIGGVIVMHDTWMASIKATKTWIAQNLGNSIQIVEQKFARNMMVLVKIAPDDRAWDHFVPFSTEFRDGN
mmetsp:Transcript_19978/g.35465  ORF Transcript_19978/g.35465 Transcript_19978/m.35465 type:complete len:341 (-) Transcript_19978:24-1046(-)|eukprot:CAMPEP_0201878570 /NCGR_PEP_ID=MMETSP0902-20130614/9705_1 /ASSEMBLY_ACC=CAM_ASM_000551 /TAXON_ID=420261 /ORGANISM="Thalassiosira antarctica, Strain CCMP982" /LENGTH=340 /DNA_ID=CAMNT_0048406241 /DNA_START=42 /DNA_END=1064 /DNA_ORIENTATION=+